MTKPKTRGVLIIALGSPFYGNLAANLAASIRFTAPGIPIHLVWAENALDHLSEQKRGLFHSLQECPPEYYYRKNKKGDGLGKRVYVKAKTHAYDLSPFDKTIFIDADVIMNPRQTLDKVFDKLDHLDFTMENRSRVNLAKPKPGAHYLWADLDEIKKEFKLTEGYLYGLHSEFIFFKKNARIAEYFECVKGHFEKPRVKMTHVFDGDIPDEYAFAMAMIEKEIYPHVCPFIPLYWYLTDKNKGSALSYVHQNYAGYSVGGNATPQAVQDNYNAMARAYFQRLGVQNPYKLRTKREVLPSRVKM